MSFLETIGSLVVAAILAGLVGLVVAGFGRRLTGGLDPGRQRQIGYGLFGVVTVLGFVWMLRADRTDRFLASPEAERLANTIWAVLLAVAVSAILFVAANLLFNQAGKSLARFSALMGGVIGFVTFGLLDGNRLIQHIVGRDGLAEALHDVVNANEWTLLLFSMLIAALLFAGLGYAVGWSSATPRRPGATVAWWSVWWPGSCGACSSPTASRSTPPSPCCGPR